MFEVEPATTATRLLFRTGLGSLSASTGDTPLCIGHSPLKTFAGRQSRIDSLALHWSMRPLVGRDLSHIVLRALRQRTSIAGYLFVEAMRLDLERYRKGLRRGSAATPRLPDCSGSSQASAGAPGHRRDAVFGPRHFAEPYWRVRRAPGRAADPKKKTKRTNIKSNKNPPQ